jgi:putative spermidine/putrescine transport system permease protein
MWKALRVALTTLTVIYLIAPMVIILVISFSSASFLTFPPPGFSMQWYRNLFENPQWASTFITSLKIVLPSAICATVLGTAAAIALSRSNFRGKPFVAGLLLSPLVVPVIVIGAGIYEFYSQIGLSGTLVGFVAAHTMLALPYVLSIVMASMTTLGKQYEQAASTLGARPLTNFRRIMFPLLAPSILSGLLFAFVISFDELIVSIFISSPTFKPVSVQMWSDVNGDVNPTIAAIGSVLFLASLVVVFLEAWSRRVVSSNSAARK